MATLSTLSAPPKAAPATSNTFYAIYGTEGGMYVQAGAQFRFGGTAAEARQFSTIRQLLEYVNTESDLGEIEIRRVTRLITPGTTSRRILDHGEQAPAGAEIKFQKVNLYMSLKDLQTYYGHETLYATEIEVNRAIAKSSPDPGYGVRRTVVTTTNNKITYKEEVVQ